MEPGGLLEYNIKKEVTCRGTENSPERDSFPGESLHIKKENGDRLIESGVMDDPQFIKEDEGPIKNGVSLEDYLLLTGRDNKSLRWKKCSGQNCTGLLPVAEKMNDASLQAFYCEKCLRKIISFNGMKNSPSLVASIPCPSKVTMETPEEKRERLDRKRIYEALRRNRETPEERDLRLEKKRIYMAEKRKQETPEQRRARLDLRNIREKMRRKETSEERARRLQKKRIYEAYKRRTETPEQRSLRLEKKRIYMAQRREEETPGERRARLDLRNTKAKIMRNGTPQDRYQRMRMYQEHETDLKEDLDQPGEGESTYLAESRDTQAIRKQNDCHSLRVDADSLDEQGQPIEMTRVT